MRKRFLATLLALCMVLGMLPGTALAEDSRAPSTATTSEVVVNLPDFNPQILYYNDQRQVVCCIKFYFVNDADILFDWPEVVMFEYDDNGHLKSSEAVHPGEHGGGIITEFYCSRDGHLDYTYVGDTIEARTSDGYLVWVRNQNGLLVHDFSGSSGRYYDYDYRYDQEGTITHITENMYATDYPSVEHEYDIIYNENGQITQVSPQSQDSNPLYTGYVYTYDKNSRMLSTDFPLYDDVSFPISFSYDAAGELAAIKGFYDEWANYTFYDYAFATKRVGSNLQLSIKRSHSGLYEETFEFSIPMKSAANPDRTKLSGKFKFASDFSKAEHKDWEADYYYDDAYFYGDASTYNPSLATMSMCLEMSSFSSNETDQWYISPDKDVQDKLINAKQLLSEIEFQHFYANDFWKAVPTKDSIGVAFARKRIKDDSNKPYTLIAVVIRGSGYDNEWASNFTIGSPDQYDEHRGFSEAKQEVLNELKRYVGSMTEKESPNLKLWIVGYSRGGATANMVAGDLTKGYSLLDKVVSPENIYCYTFETPMGVLSKDAIGDFTNIHNVLSINDLVPYVAPTAWGFTRYNKINDHLLPHAAKNSNWYNERAAMLKQFHALGFTAGDYNIREKSVVQNLRIDTNKFLPGGEPLWWMESSEIATHDILIRSVNFLAKSAIRSREYYAQELEYGVRQVLGILTHYDGIVAGSLDYAGEVLDPEKLFEHLEELFTPESIMYITAPMFSVNPLYKLESRKTDVKIRLMEKMGGILGEYAQIEGFIEALGDVLKNIFEEVAIDVWYNSTDTINIIINLTDLIASGSVESAHYSEICLAWLRSQDENYTRARVQSNATSSDITRIVRINCPADVTVTNGSEIVASIIGDTVLDIDSSVLSFVNNGEKIVYLPGDSSYQIAITATNYGFVSYAVNEYNYLYNNETRVLNYVEVDVVPGDILTGIIPAISDVELMQNSQNGSTADYTLIDGTTNVAHREYTGNAIQTYEVTLVKDGTGGYISGAGSFLVGHYATVEAQTLPNEEFLGWYVDGVLVSQDMVYRFTVTKDITVTAKFTEAIFHKLEIGSTAGGTVMGATGSYSAGIEIELIAEAAPGYEFVTWISSNGGTFDIPTNPESTFTMPAEDVTVTANFRRINESGVENIPNNYAGGTNSGARTYKITIPSVVGGTITASPISATKGTIITVTTTLDVGYKLSSLTVTDKDGKELPLTDKGNGKYTFTMPASNVTVNATFEPISSEPTTPPAEDTPSEPTEISLPFIDVFPADWFYSSVQYVYTNGLMTGTTATEFSPNAGMTRAMVWMVLGRMAGADVNNANGEWYAKAQEWAITNNVSDGTNPDNSISRQELVTMLWRYIGSPTAAVDLGQFSDDETVADWADGAMQWSVSTGLIVGDNGRLNPVGNARRCEVATIFMRFCENIVRA